MNFSFASTDPSRNPADLWVLTVFENEFTEKKGALPALTSADKKLRGLLIKSASAEGFKAKADQSFLLHSHGKVKPSRIMLAGLGARTKYTHEALRLLSGRVVKAAAKLKVKTVAFSLPTVADVDGAIKAAVEGLALGAYRFDKYLSKTDGHGVSRVVFTLPAGAKRHKGHDAAATLGHTVAQATNWARTLVNEPSNTMTPVALADAAAAMAKELGLVAVISDRKEIDKLKMGLFSGVAQGSELEPRLIHLTYVPKDAEAAKREPVCFVGKGLTFDSGGLSLKTADGMYGMKIDMAGSAAVLGAMRVVAHLKPPFPVHAFVGACENMPSGRSYRPGDILTSRLGKTVEITNTDAEGRLVLADVLAYASELKPAAIIDLATLTGACMVALGHHIAGAMGDDDTLCWNVLEAARAAGEELWRLPLSDLQKDTLKSDVADLKNLGDRMGGAINAGLFLREFVGQTPWVHLDIAGPAESSKDRGYLSKGATGMGVRTLSEFVRRRMREFDVHAA